MSDLLERKTTVNWLLIFGGAMIVGRWLLVIGAGYVVMHFIVKFW